MSKTVTATLFSDPACPWAYSASPALRVMEWRYREQLSWRLVLIGLSENADRYLANGYTASRMAQGHLRFRDRYGMPFSGEAKSSVSGSSRACRAVIAARQIRPGDDWTVFRALQLANFNTGLVFDDDDQLRAALDRVEGVDAVAIVSALDTPPVIAEYESDKALARTAAGTSPALQGKTANSDGAERYTAPSVVFEREGRDRIVVGGFQPVEAYDLAVTNLDPTLRREPPAADVAAALEYFPDGLTTQEVAELMREDLETADRASAEAALVELEASGRAIRRALGNDALWTATAQ